MGAAAYYRGSAAISDSIQRDYMEKRGGYRRQLKKQMLRAELRIRQLEQFCRDAQALYIDITYTNSGKGLLRGSMRRCWIKSREQKAFVVMLDRCNKAHCNWVDSNHHDVFNHLAKCKEWAVAWYELIEKLNESRVKYPFNIPPLK